MWCVLFAGILFFIGCAAVNAVVFRYVRGLSCRRSRFSLSEIVIVGPAVVPWVLVRVGFLVFFFFFLEYSRGFHAIPPPSLLAFEPTRAIKIRCCNVEMRTARRESTMGNSREIRKRSSTILSTYMTRSAKQTHVLGGVFLRMCPSRKSISPRPSQRLRRDKRISFDAGDMHARKAHSGWVRCPPPRLGRRSGRYPPLVLAYHTLAPPYHALTLPCPTLPYRSSRR